MVNKVNTEQFNELMKEDAVLVDFSATWCGPCKMLAPIMASVSEKLAGKCKVVSVDVDESSDLAEKFGIMAVPTVILFKKGEQVVVNIFQFQKKDEKAMARKFALSKLNKIT